MIFMPFLKTYHQKILDYSLALLVFFVPLSFAFPNILLVPAGLMFVYKTFVDNEIKFSLHWLLCMLLLFLVLILALIQGDFINELGDQKKFITGLLVFLLIKEVSKLKLVEFSFVFGVIVAIVNNLIYIVYKYFQGVSLDLSYGSSVLELLLFDRPYLAFFTVLANFLIFKWIRQGKFSWYYVLAILSAGFCFFITAKLGIILHVLLIIHHAYRSIKKIKLKHILLLLFISLSVGFVLLKNPYLKERLRIQSDFEATYKKYKAYEIRFIVWDCSLETIKDNWLFGVQSHQNLIPIMTDCYVSKIEPGRTKKIMYYKTEKFNTHNQFLDIWLIAGIPGLLLLVSLFVIPFFRQDEYKDMRMLLILFLLFMLVENIFQRQLGCFLFGIFFGLYAPVNHKISWSKQN